ncbi:hypothetical protein LXL04_013487 [Taraxacum kok-saghyz]
MLPKLPSNLPPHLSLKLIKTYCQSNDLRRARQLFDKTTNPDLHSWTVLISAYTRNNLQNEAINLYTQLRDKQLQPDKFVLLSVVKACATSADLIQAQKAHKDAVTFQFHHDLLLGNAMIDMFAKCKHLEGAKTAFNDLQVRDVISWTSISSCYVTCGKPRKGLETFKEMVSNGVKPNSISLSSILPACSDLKCLNFGQQIHGFIIKNGMSANVFVTSALINMYATCLSIKEAEMIFNTMVNKDTVSHNVMISAYFENKQPEKAVSMFKKMKENNSKLNFASWNSVISGCLQLGQTQQALNLLSEMQESGFKPNQITLTTAMTACTNIESLRKGKEIHSYIFRHHFLNDTTTLTALIFMYAKCGKIQFSKKTFEMMPEKTRDTIAWNTIILANSMHGNGEESLKLLKKMVKSGVKPNAVTFTGVLSGCSHSRLVDEGLYIFNSMSKIHLIEPDAEHHACVVDILSRAGRLETAYNFIQNMTIKPTPSAYGALLGGCKVYKNVDLGRIVAKKLFEIEPNNPGNYVLLSNILVNAKLWGEASETRRLMRDKGMKKEPGCSWVQVKNKVHTFVVGDKRNEYSDDIYKFLSDMSDEMRRAGYLPDTEFVLQDVDGEEKEDTLCNHSEKLAVAFGIMNLRGESEITVFKNLRICGDCHNAIKIMAKIVGVRIVVRDSLRFHHFSHGYCSCNDFW